jgi:hypothetical protein
MADALQRIVYETTVDDALDVAWRFSSRTQAFQKQLRQNGIIAGVAAAGGFVAAFVFAGATDPSDLIVAVAGAVAFGVLFGWLYKRFLLKETRKQHRKIIAEQFGGKPSLPCEVELRADALWSRVGAIEMLFPWSISTGVQGNAEDIELNFSQGICVVKNRRFASSSDQQAFLETARRLSAKRDQ